MNDSVSLSARMPPGVMMVTYNAPDSNNEPPEDNRDNSLTTMFSGIGLKSSFERCLKDTWKSA